MVTKKMKSRQTKRSYSELMLYESFDERFKYLMLGDVVGSNNHLEVRFLLQEFYKTKEWRSFREKIIIRDSACDLGVLTEPIFGKGNLIIHHINPITTEQVMNNDPCITDPENVITTKSNTHRYIHYGTDEEYGSPIIERSPHDTSPWRR